MKKLITLSLLLAFSISIYAQPVVYFDFVTHNEETQQWTVTNFYNSNRAKLITLADYFQTNGITWNMQSDWIYLSSVLTKETPTLMAVTNNKNIQRYLHEDKGVEMDPHAHESTYIYPDVVMLMDSIGLPESKIMGGSIYNDSNGVNVWTHLINGQNGLIFPNKFWQPDFMMGGGTPNHVADIKYYGFWNPTDTNAYLTHNPSSPLHHLGVGCSIKIKDTSAVANVVADLRAVVTNVQNGTYPSNGIYLQTIFFEQAELNDAIFYNKVIQVADSVNQWVASGQAQWKTLAQVGDYWINTYNSQVFQWNCGQIATGIETADKSSTMSIYPNPFSSVATLKTGIALNNASANIYNSYGQLEQHLEDLSGEEITFYRGNLSAGLYLLRLIEDNQTIMTGRLIVAD